MLVSQHKYHNRTPIKATPKNGQLVMNNKGFWTLIEKREVKKEKEKRLRISGRDTMYLRNQFAPRRLEMVLCDCLFPHSMRLPTLSKTPIYTYIEKQIKKKRPRISGHDTMYLRNQFALRCLK